MFSWLDDVRTWIGGFATIAGGWYFKWKSDRREELKIIIEQLRAELDRKSAECERKGLENERFRVLSERLAKATGSQQLEIVLYKRASATALEELHIALERIRAVPPEDAEEYLERAVRILEEEVVIPTTDEQNSNKN